MPRFWLAGKADESYVRNVLPPNHAPKRSNTQAFPFRLDGQMLHAQGDFRALHDLAEECAECEDVRW